LLGRITSTPRELRRRWHACCFSQIAMSSPRILVADDDPNMLESVADALEGIGAHVTRAHSGSELIESFERGPFDLIVTDISMPWMSGLQAMHSVRTAGLITPVIVMTALDDARLADQVRTLGRDAVLMRKPFALAELEHTARTMLARGP
jgi:CheY-like chemotaxis protein